MSITCYSDRRVSNLDSVNILKFRAETPNKWTQKSKTKIRKSLRWVNMNLRGRTGVWSVFGQNEPQE